MRTLLAGALLALAACAAGAPSPEWPAVASGALRHFESAYLGGDSRLAEQEFARARAALSSTGRADLVARAELVRCAARVASLEFDECPAYQALAGDASPTERAYAAYLAGRAQGADMPLLPEHHRAAAAGDAGSVGAIADPFARLVAAGVLFRAGQVTPTAIALAIDTASARGWRRPLLAWLGVQAKRAEEAGDRDAAAALRRRMRLVAGEDAAR